MVRLKSIASSLKLGMSTRNIGFAEPIMMVRVSKKIMIKLLRLVKRQPRRVIWMRKLILVLCMTLARVLQRTKKRPSSGI